MVELLAAKPKVDKLKGAGLSEVQAEVLSCIINWDENRPDLTRGLCLPDRRRVLHELCLAFPHEADDDEATILALAKALCTPDGRGRVSLHQITAFLSRYTDKPTVVEEESDCEQETEQKEKEKEKKEKKEVAADTEKKKEKEEETEAEAESEGGDGEDSVSSSSTAKWKGRVQQRRCSTSRLTYSKCHAQPSSSLPQRPSPSQPM